MLHFVLIVAEDATFLERPELQILRRLRVKFEQILELLGVEAHGPHMVLLSVHVRLVRESRCVRLELDVTLQIADELIVVENGMLG